MTGPFISIVMPVYNNEKLLPNAVNSVLHQTFHDWELIIIDDGSTDHTPQAADKLAAMDRRIYVIHQENQGIFKSYNTGYKVAAGEYALIVNSDDTINRDALKEIHDIAVVDGADIVMFNLSISQCDAEQNVIAADLYGYRNLLDKAFSYHDREELHQAWPYMIKCKLLNHQCVYNRKLYKVFQYQGQYFADDVLYNQRIADVISTAAGTPYVVYNWYMYASNTMNASSRKYYGYEHEMYDKLYWGYRKILEKWGAASPEALDILAAVRLQQLTTEIRSYSAPQCPLSTEEKILEILKNASDKTVYSCAADTGRLEEWESRVLSGIRELLIKEPLDSGSKCYFIYELLDCLLRYEKAGEDIQKLRASVYHRCNPKNIGRGFLQKLGLDKVVGGAVEK